ncbi:hypothetical protein WDV06_32400 [Streptomyces racemochromogenes]|uniref:Uncharacterized protein n=1 Tax=Streptomyces racemochromogenes TaxID=67353 RepID=A0ABW7PMX0_9ACTN
MKTQADPQPTSRNIEPEQRIRTCRPALLRSDCCTEPADPYEDAGFEPNVVRGED